MATGLKEAVLQKSGIELIDTVGGFVTMTDWVFVCVPHELVAAN